MVPIKRGLVETLVAEALSGSGYSSWLSETNSSDDENHTVSHAPINCGVGEKPGGMFRGVGLNFPDKEACACTIGRTESLVACLR